MPTPAEQQVQPPPEIVPDTVADDKLYPRQTDDEDIMAIDDQNNDRSSHDSTLHKLSGESAGGSNSSIQSSKLDRRPRKNVTSLFHLQENCDEVEEHENGDIHDVDDDSVSRQKRRAFKSKHISPITRIDAYQNHFFTKRDTATCTSSFLRPGSTFAGTQQSGRSTYEVNVEIKRVDMENAFICGYLRIEGLTEDHPTLITYFEGEMISDKHSFYTRREDWGANDKTDVAHWSRFPPWRMIAKQAKEHKYVHTNYTEKSHIYMRWKECFLVPDHRVIDIVGASYAGFYYICFDQSNGSFTGFYFHQRSDKYQQLDLSYCQNSGQYPRYEFR